MAVVTVTNAGPDVAASSYWGSELDRAGSLFLTSNAGAVRLLLPSGWGHLAADMAGAVEVVLSRGPWAADPGRGRDSLELLFEDGTADPFVVHLDAKQADRLPLAADAGRAFRFSAWAAPEAGGGPRKVADMPLYYRTVGAVPHLKPRTP